MLFNQDECCQILQEMVKKYGTVSIFIVREEYEVTAGFIRASDANLQMAILASRRGIAPAKKRCVNCGRFKSLSEFPKDRNRAEGYHHTCLECERPRWQKAKRKARAEIKRKKLKN